MTGPNKITNNQDLKAMSHHTNLDAPEFTRRFVNLADERLGA
jgi:allantoicase